MTKNSAGQLFLTFFEVTRRNDILIITELLLDSYQRLYERLQNIKVRLEDDAKEKQKNRNKMLNFDIRTLPTFKEYTAVNDFYYDMPRSALATAARQSWKILELIFIFGQHPKFWLKMEILFKNRKFWSNIELLITNQNFGKKFNFPPKNDLVKNRDFIKKSRFFKLRFWSEIEILISNSDLS